MRDPEAMAGDHEPQQVGEDAGSCAHAFEESASGKVCTKCGHMLGASVVGGGVALVQDPTSEFLPA